MIAIKKNIDLGLTISEKQLLKAKGILQKNITNYAIDEIASVINATPHRTKTLTALYEFQSIPSIGIKFAEDLILLGYYNVSSLQHKSAPELLNTYEKTIGYRIDPCVEDQFRLVVHYANYPDSTKKWWDFTTERKAFRNKHGYPADRPL